MESYLAPAAAAAAAAAATGPDALQSFLFPTSSVAVSAGRQEVDSLGRQELAGALQLPPLLPGAPGSGRRRRTHFTVAQLAYLEEAFQATGGYPSHSTRVQVAEHTGLDESRVQVWFQNRRAKRRRQAVAVAGLHVAPQMGPLPLPPSPLQPIMNPPTRTPPAAGPSAAPAPQQQQHYFPPSPVPSSASPLGLHQSGPAWEDGSDDALLQIGCLLAKWDAPEEEERDCSFPPWAVPNGVLG